MYMRRQETATSAQLQDHATVYCGTHHIAYADLRDAARMIQNDASPQGMLRTFAPLRDDGFQRVYQAWSEIRTMDDWYAEVGNWLPRYRLRTLAAMSLRACSNPLDRVYAVRALLNVQNEPSLVPDYTLTPVEVYRRLVVVLLEVCDEDQPWALLALVGTAPGRSVEASYWPLWVPDFNALTSRSRTCIQLYTEILWLQVPQFLPDPALFTTQIEGHGDRLRIRGQCFATVQEIFANTEYPTLKETHSDRISPDELAIFRAWYARCLRCINMSAIENEEVIAHSTTFLACGIQLAHLPREMEDEKEAIDHSGGWLFPDKWPEDPNTVREHFMLLCASEHSPPDKSRLIARITLDGEQGVQDYCWVPPDAEKHDRVCVVAGASFPFVLRELSNGYAKVVGDAYLANTTLKQALGGGSTSRWDEDIYEEVDHPPTDDWNAQDQSMQELIAGIGSIVL